jgi:hypothetical protein
MEDLAFENQLSNDPSESSAQKAPLNTPGYRNLTFQSLTPQGRDLNEDKALTTLRSMSHCQKDKLTCDRIFCLYLRDLCKKVNETYYKTILRFVLLYRECMNEYGWIKRRETLNRAKITEEMDEILWSLKLKEVGEEALKKVEPLPEPSEEVKDENKQDGSAQ